MAGNKAYALQAWAYALRDIARLLLNSVIDKCHGIHIGADLHVKI